MEENSNSNAQFNSVLLLTDFSQNSRHAIIYIIKALGDNVEYNIVNAYFVKTTSGTLLDLNEIVAKESEADLKKETEFLRAEFPEYELKIKTHSLFGSPVDAIELLIKNGSHDLVVMGTKGASGFDALIYGSTASSVMFATELPVLAIPPDAQFVGIKKIVFANDNEGIKNDSILNPVYKFQNLFKCSVTVLYVGNNTSIHDLPKDDFHFSNAKFTNIKSEEVVDQVINYCIEENADILVLLPRHTSFFSRIFHKSISKQIMLKAKIPVLALENRKD